MIALCDPIDLPEIGVFPWSAAAEFDIFHGMNQSRSADAVSRSAFPLSDSELGALLLHALDVRERIILELMALSGLRLAEVCTLEIARVDVKGRTVQVVGKGDKVRTIPISGGTADKLRLFIGRRLRGYVFPGQNGRPHITVRAVQYMIAAAGARVGFKQKAPTLTQLNPHTLRHTAARRMKAC